MTDSDDSTVAAVDIARLAGVGRAAVGNWRRRFTDFPDPVGGTASSPLYRLGDVERWLTAHDRAIEVTPADRVWQWLRTEVDDLQLGSYVGQLGVFVVFLQREPATWRALVGASDAVAVGRAVAAAVPELPAGFPERPDAELLGVLHSVADVVAGQGAVETFRFLVERYFEAHLRRLPVTPQPIAEFLVRLADVSGRSVLDPACGTGSILTAAHTEGATLLAGQEIDPAAARLSGVQLLLQQSGESGRPRAEVVVGDSLRADAFTGRRFDVVVSFPPWGDRGWSPEELAGDPRWEYGLPPRGEPDLAWL